VKVSAGAKSALSSVEGALIIGIYEDDDNLPVWVRTLPDKDDTILKNAVIEDDYKGEFGKTLLIRGAANSKLRKILLIGLGKRSEWSEERARRAAGKSRTALNSSRQYRATMTLFDSESDPAVAKAQVEGFILSGYTFNKYKSKKTKKDDSIEFRSLQIINTNGIANAALKRAVKLGEIISTGAILALLQHCLMRF